VTARSLCRAGARDVDHAHSSGDFPRQRYACGRLLRDAVYDFPFHGGRSISPCRSEPGDVGRIHRRRITLTCPLAAVPQRAGHPRRLGQGPPIERCKASAGARGQIASLDARLTLRDCRAIARVSPAKLSRAVTAGTQNGARASPQVSASLPACGLRSLRAPRSSGQSSAETLLLTPHRSPARSLLAF
jgi:hypothetical protein